MKEEYETVHIYEGLIKKNFNVLMILIPSLVFVLVLGIYILNKPKDQVISVERENPVALQAQDARKLIIINGNEIEVEVVDDEIGRREGLSGREVLEDNKGMLFVFEAINFKPAFWMKDMLFPIDIIWVNDGVITQIDKNIGPPETVTSDEDLRLYLPNDEIDYVIEVNGGFCDRMMIRTGDSVDLSQAL